MKKIVLLLSILCIVPSISLAQFSRSVVLPTNGRTLTEQLELERLEAEKKAQEEAEKERKKQEEIARQKAEEARIEAEKKAEQARLEAERKAEQARKEAEEKAAAERKKLELEAERKRQLEEKARIEAEKKAEQERIKAEQMAKTVEERIRLKNEEQTKKELEKEKARLERKARIAAYPWSNFIMVNGGFSSTPDYTFGITYARVKLGGFYVSAMSNFGFKFDSDYIGNYDGSLYGDYYNDIKGIYQYYSNDYYPMYTGKKKHTRMSVTAGGVIRMGIPLYAYTGLGYGYRGVFLQTVGDEWVEIHNGNTVYHGVAFEVGLMGNIKGFAISAGFSMLGNLNGIYPEAKIGLGYCF